MAAAVGIGALDGPSPDGAGKSVAVVGFELGRGVVGVGVGLGVAFGVGLGVDFGVGAAVGPGTVKVASA